MIDPAKVDMNQLPKKFCDGAIGAYGKDFFAFALTSGNSLDSFAVTPPIMKVIAAWMQRQVDSYGQAHGTIDISPPKIISPIQFTDLPGRGKDEK